MLELILLVIIAVYVYSYRKNNGENVYKFISDAVVKAYNQYAPYSFKEVREKVKDLGQEYNTRQYLTQVLLIGGFAAVVSYLYFFSIIWTIVYVIAAIMFIPYLAYLRCKRVYSEFVFEQIQVYVTNTIMEFSVTQSFVKALEGVYNSGILEDPVKTDIKIMIDLAYHNGDVGESIEYMNSKYDYYMVRNMHQLFLQITREGARDTTKTLDNMLLDIDELVEGVYRDRLDRKAFHRQFVQFGVLLYLMIMLVQLLIKKDVYIELVNSNILMRIALHIIVLTNSYFLLSGEKYYNENVGAE